MRFFPSISIPFLGGALLTGALPFVVIGAVESTAFEYHRRRVKTRRTVCSAPLSDRSPERHDASAIVPV
jgi:hypothetical protein